MQSGKEQQVVTFGTEPEDEDGDEEEVDQEPPPEKADSDWDSMSSDDSPDDDLPLARIKSFNERKLKASSLFTS